MILKVLEVEVGTKNQSKINLKRSSTWEGPLASIFMYFEAFSDRRYTDEGLLQSRLIEGAVLSESDALLQAKQLISSGTVTTASGATLAIEADSLCVHGDTKGAVNIAKKIRTFL